LKHFLQPLASGRRIRHLAIIPCGGLQDTLALAQIDVHAETGPYVKAGKNFRQKEEKRAAVFGAAISSTGGTSLTVCFAASVRHWLSFSVGFS